MKHVGPKRRPSGRTDESFDINHAVAEILRLLREELQMQGCEDEAVGAAASHLVESGQKTRTTAIAWPLALALDEIAATLVREAWRPHAKALRQVLVAGIEYHSRQHAALKRICDAMSRMPLPPNSPSRPSWEKNISDLRSLAESHRTSPLGSNETSLALLQQLQTAEPLAPRKVERALLRDRLFQIFAAGGVPVRHIAYIMNRDSKGASEEKFKTIIDRTRSRRSIT